MRIPLLATASFLSITPVVAQDQAWPDHIICSAGVYHYFMLDGTASFRTEGPWESWIGFRSPSGYDYDCRVEDDVIAFRWNNDCENLDSRSTTFEIDEDILTIEGDMTTYDYERNGDGWRRLD